MTPEPSQDIDLVEEPQQQKDEVNHHLEFFTMTREPSQDIELVEEP